MTAGSPRPRVLIVDDIDDNIAILGRTLASEHEISFALSGPQALAMIANQPPDLVLLDVMMPGMDGLETLRRIKALPGAQDVPVIMVTGDGRSETQVLGLELGAADFLSKPVDLSILRARVRNVLERERLVRQLVHLATTDGLTAVANRRRFFQLAEAELLRVRRYGSLAGLLMVDLDQFKQVNDRYGHAAGDAVLRHFAGLARERLRAVDTIGRIGGEEFAILLPDTALNGAQAFAEQLCAHTAASSVATPHGRMSFSVSIGVTAIVPTDRLLDEVLARADAALYVAKKSGRNRVRVVAVPLATPAGGVGESRPAGDPGSSELPVLAVGEALERLDGDRAMFMLAASPLPEQIAGDRASIAEAVRVGDSVAMRRATHRLRGALALVGAERACAACQALEVAVKERSVLASPDSSADEAVFQSLRQALEYELDALLPELLALLRAAEGDLAKGPTEESTHAG